MEKIEGEMLWSVLVHSEPRKRVALITQFCGLFVQLHRLDWQPFATETEQINFTDPLAFVDLYMSGLYDAASTFPDLKVFQPICFV